MTAVDADREPPGAEPASGVWSPERRRLTAGLVLTVTLVAFESLAVSTVMPRVSEDLGGLGLYGWVFSGFFLGILVGAVFAGRVADTRGTAPPFILGLVLFSIGLAVAGAAPSMIVLVAARVLQGIGAGAIPAVAYISVGRFYPSAIRPRVFAVFSTAWVVPGVVGPAAASAIEQAFSWRVVFLAILPLVAVAAAMTVPALRHGGAAAPPAADADATAARPDRRVGRAVLLAVSAGTVLAGTTAGSPAVAVALVAVGLPPALWALVRLVPPGTLRVAPGLPAAVALRGVLTCAFFATDSFIPLAITDVRHQATWVAGAALTAATMTWTAASWIQQRRVHVDGPRRVVAAGFAAVALGIGGAHLVLVTGVPLPVAIAAWAVAGFGIGLAYSTLSVTVLDRATRGAEGAATSSLQLTDVLGTALGTGAVGALIDFGDGRRWLPSSSLHIAFGFTLALAVLGLVLSRRLPSRLVS